MPAHCDRADQSTPIRTELMTEVDLLLAKCKSNTTDDRDMVTVLEQTAVTLECGESRTKSLAALDRLRRSDMGRSTSFATSAKGVAKNSIIFGRSNFEL